MDSSSGPRYKVLKVSDTPQDRSGAKELTRRLKSHGKYGFKVTHFKVQKGLTTLILEKQVGLRYDYEVISVNTVVPADADANATVHGLTSGQAEVVLQDVLNQHSDSGFRIVYLNWDDFYDVRVIMEREISIAD